MRQFASVSCVAAIGVLGVSVVTGGGVSPQRLCMVGVCAAHDVTPEHVVDRVVGVWQRPAQPLSDGQAEEVFEQFGICPIRVEGLDHAVYVEHAIGQLGPDPKSQRVMSVYTTPSGLNMRLWNFRVEQRADVLAGMWASPEDFPSIRRDELFPVADFVLDTSDEQSLTSKTLTNASIDVDGALFYDAGLNVYENGEADRTLVFRERGFSAHSTNVFDTLKEPWTYVESSATVHRLDEGVVTIDYHRPEGVPAFDSNIMFLKYTMYIGDGSMTDNTDRHGGIFRESLPVREGKFLGWKLGLPGMTNGGYRLIIMPPGTGAPGDTETLYARIELVQLEQDVPPDQP